MTYYIHETDDVPIVANSIRHVEGWILGALRAGRIITITRPGQQPWHNKTWKKQHENHHD